MSFPAPLINSCRSSVTVFRSFIVVESLLYKPSLFPAYLIRSYHVMRPTRSQTWIDHPRLDLTREQRSPWLSSYAPYCGNGSPPLNLSFFHIRGSSRAYGYLFYRVLFILFSMHDVSNETMFFRYQEFRCR